MNRYPVRKLIIPAVRRDLQRDFEFETFFLQIDGIEEERLIWNAERLRFEPIPGPINIGFMEKYGSFEALKAKEQEGTDYQIQYRQGETGIAVIAPHGGGIEPGTSEIADGVAGDDHAFYSFEGWKRQGNFEMHITSRNFDEPIGVDIVKNSNTIVSIHGCNGNEKVVYIGGIDTELIERIKTALSGAGFLVKNNARFPGTSPFNICNRSRLGKGVQLEISAPLRWSMFRDLTRPERKTPTKYFLNFVAALRRGLGEP